MSQNATSPPAAKAGEPGKSDCFGGDRFPSSPSENAAQGRRAATVNMRRFEKNTLRAFFDLELTSGLVLRDCTLKTSIGGSGSQQSLTPTRTAKRLGPQSSISKTRRRATNFSKWRSRPRSPHTNSKGKHMKSAFLDARICRALSSVINMFREPIAGVFVEIEPRAVNYIATDGHVLIGHRVEAAADMPENSLLVDFMLPANVCQSFGDGESLACVAEHEGAKLLLSYDDERRTFDAIAAPFLENWRQVLPKNISNEPAQLDPYLIARVVEVAEDLRGDVFLDPPHIAHNGPDGACAVTWAQLPLTFAVLMPRRSDPSPLPRWVLHTDETQAAAE
jgi:hypothetical protein